MIDQFAGIPATLDSPFERCEVIAPDNERDLTYLTRALYCGSGGTIVVHDKQGQEVVFKNLQAGQILPGRFSRVKVSSQTGSPTETTTATGIVGLS